MSDNQAWLDLYRLDDTLSDEERLIRQTVRSFVSHEVKPRLGEFWERGEFPVELVPRMGELGLFGPTLTGHGLPGLGNRA